MDYCPCCGQPLVAGLYVCQPMPQVPSHIKIGWSTNFKSRQKSYRTACPDAQFLRTWPCLSQQTERQVIKMLESKGFERIGPEVFVCHDLPKLLGILDTFFASLLDKDAQTLRSRSQQRRKKGEGSIYKRASDGRWCGQLTSPTGERISLYGYSEKEVQEKLEEAKKDLSRITRRIIAPAIAGKRKRGRPAKAKTR